MRISAVTWYVTGVCVVGAALAALQDWSVLLHWGSTDWWGFGTLVFLGLAAEHQAWTIEVGRTAGGSSIAFLPLLTVVLLFGPTAGVLFWIISGPVAEYLIRRKPAIRANFNIGQYVASTAVAGLVFEAFGGEGLAIMLGPVGPAEVLGQVGPFVLFSVVFLVVNNGTVAGVIAINQGIPVKRTWQDLVGKTILLDLLIGPIAIAVGALFLQVGAVGLLLAILPLLFVRHSYQTQRNLELANRDLLKALVKAIETRDPYTSGHSVRVSYLARRIAEQLGLLDSQVERIEMAALLHDIGKIEAVYTDILRKPDSLTPGEREVIESHVTKGEELLRALASVPDEVASAVRHHHEREDGRGYPDGLLGDEIPIGAKIIVVCDSVDAMLSDRPYRKALSSRVVREQLYEHAGKQFDHRVVRALLDSDILRDYEEIMSSSRRGVTPDLTERGRLPRASTPARRRRPRSPLAR